MPGVTDEGKVPRGMICELSKKIVRDPVRTPYGHVSRQNATFLFLKKNEEKKLGKKRKNRESGKETQTFRMSLTIPKLHPPSTERNVTPKPLAIVELLSQLITHTHHYISSYHYQLSCPDCWYAVHDDTKSRPENA